MPDVSGEVGDAPYQTLASPLTARAGRVELLPSLQLHDRIFHLLALNSPFIPLTSLFHCCPLNYTQTATWFPATA
jgi:hypothetical protein